MTHTKEDLIMEHSQNHGLEMVKPGICYDGDSLENLPDKLRNYWEAKSDDSISNRELEIIGDQAVEWIQENKSFKKRFLEWLK